MKTLLVVLATFLAQTCTQEQAGVVEFRGQLEKQGITTYQYGTHVISDGKITYALRSETIDMDKYVGQKVMIKGLKIPGFPIESGPEYVEVSLIIP